MKKVQKNLDIEKLRKSFSHLFVGMDLQKIEIEFLFSELIEMYEQEGRYYHNLKHIERMLSFLERRVDRIEDWVSIQLAVWFHDCIYDIHDSKNEERSADFARKRLSDLGISEDLVEKVADLILLTKKHEITTKYFNYDTKIFLDSDLISLGGSFEEYSKIFERIKKEYSEIPSEVFKNGRRIFLQSILSKPRIFYTDEMFVEFEQDARRNLERELVNL
ncbi:MAG TPA: hypothetical protein PKL44_02290 [Candidatus Dojkabacteria bacterium]|nr:hypothetical protein [Candidatus Dojkabacteria bacterium]